VTRRQELRGQIDEPPLRTAYTLSLNGIVPADGKVDKDSLPKIKMPNRDGFIPDAVFKIDNEPEAPAKRGVAR
jgi:hypothetical protein